MGRTYHVNGVGGAIDLPSQQFEDAAIAVYFELESTQRPVFLHKVAIALWFCMAKKKLELDRKQHRLTVINV